MRPFKEHSRSLNALQRRQRPAKPTGHASRTGRASRHQHRALCPHTGPTRGREPQALHTLDLVSPGVLRITNELQELLFSLFMDDKSEVQRSRAKIWTQEGSGASAIQPWTIYSEKEH